MAASVRYSTYINEKEYKLVPVPKPGDRISFPAACVTGVCFKRWTTENDCWRWNTEKQYLETWADNNWSPQRCALYVDGAVTVVEEPKPEPVWKDCNFIEAVEWMKKYPTMPVARWNGDEYCLGGVSNKIRRDNDDVLIYNVAIGKELDFILGKWQIKVS